MKPRFIRWILLLQGLDIESGNTKGTENLTTKFLSRLELEFIYESMISVKFINESLCLLQMLYVIKKGSTMVCWYCHYLVAKVLPSDMTYQQKKKVFVDEKYYHWENPFLFCVDHNGYVKISQKIICKVWMPSSIDRIWIRMRKK